MTKDYSCTICIFDTKETDVSSFNINNNDEIFENIFLLGYDMFPHFCKNLEEKNKIIDSQFIQGSIEFY